jgi:hypothetical protein
MAGCSAVSFSNVSAAVFNCLVNKAAEQGVTISGDSGTASKSGFTIKWNYDRAASSLTIQCTDKPTLVPCAVIKNRIKDTVHACGGQ